MAVAIKCQALIMALRTKIIRPIYQELLLAFFFLSLSVTFNESSMKAKNFNLELLMRREAHIQIGRDEEQEPRHVVFIGDLQPSPVHL